MDRMGFGWMDEEKMEERRAEMERDGGDVQGLSSWGENEMRQENEREFGWCVGHYTKREGNLRKCALHTRWAT